MTATKNAAALEQLEQKWRGSAAFLGDKMINASILNACADELATLRATLAQPDALTSQPSGEAVRWEFLMVPADRPNNPIPSRAAWTPCTKSEYDDMRANPVAGDWRYEVRALYTHPSADAPGVAVDEWPELPKASIPEDCDGECVHGPYYTADQMREYALAAMRVRGEQ